MMPRKKTTVFAFLDTNMYLQFKDFDQIEWRDVLNSQSVCIVIAPVNLSELEKFKYDHISERRRNRARSLAKKIRDIAFSVDPGQDALIPARDGVALRALAASPEMSKYPQLVASNWDDQLVASVLQFAEENVNVPREDIVLVADDSGVLIKGRANNIVTKPPDDYLRLPDEPTLDQRKIGALERRLDEIENRQPKLRLAFIFNDNPTADLLTPIQLIETPTAQELANLRKQEEALLLEKGKNRLTRPKPTESNAPRTVADVLNEVQASFTSSILGSITPAEYERYEREVREYAEEYQQFLLDLYQWQAIGSRYAGVDLVVLNEGTSPATGLVIQLTVPDGLEVQTEELEGAPEKPRAPQLPMSTADMFAHFGGGSVVLSPTIYDSLRRINSPPRPFDPDQSGPRVTPRHSTLLEWKRSKALHQLPLHLTRIWILFPSTVGEQRCSFDYRIYAENTLTAVDGSLNINAIGTLAKFNPK